MRGASWVKGLALFTLSGAIGASAQVVGWSSQEKPAIQARDIRGSGDWKTDGKAQRSTQRWSLDLARDGNSLSGTIDLSGSPLADRGNVRGKISGNRISGAITDDSGRAVASFSGRISESGMSGRYRDRTGEVGEWEWEGTLPQ